MSKATTIVEDKKYLIEAELPEATSSYTVIPHALIIDTVTKLIQERGFSIIKEIYKYNAAAQVACGIYYLSYETDEDMGMMFTWTNSYDKTVRFKCFVGAYIKLNGNLLVSNSDGGMFKRKHTGEADTEVEETISEQIGHAISYYEELIADKSLMKAKEITDEQFAEAIGRLYITDRLLSSEQINIIKREYMKPSFTYDCGKNCLWTFYNYILTGVIKCHPSKWAEQQRTIHIWMKNTYGIGEYIETRSLNEIHKDIPAREFPVIPVTKKEEPEEKAEVNDGVIKDRFGNPRKAKDEPTPTIVEETPVTEPVTHVGQDYPDAIEMAEEKLPSFSPAVLDALTANQKTEIKKSLIFSLFPDAGINTIVLINDIEFIIDGETDTHFIVLPIEGEEAPMEEPVLEEPEIEETFVAQPEPAAVEMGIKLPLHPKKMTATMPDLKPKDIQIIPPVTVREIDPKIVDEIRGKISQEILDLYGGVREFTYTKVGHQYNVLLESGESLCINKL